MSWAGPEQARSVWADAPLDDDLLAVYLDAAHEQVLAYAPALPDAPVSAEYGTVQYGGGIVYVDDTPVPERYVLAEIMQARALYRAAKAGNQDQIGPDGFAVVVYPLDHNIRNLLRPKRGVPVIL